MRRVRSACSSAPRHRASNGRSERLAFAYPAERRKNASRESGSHLRSWTPGRISVWSPAHSLGRVVGQERVRVRVEQDLVALAVDDATDQPVEIGIVRDRGEVRPDLRARVAQPHRIDVAGQDERVGPVVGATGDDRRVERVGQRSFEQPAKAWIGDSGGRGPDAPLDGIAVGGTVRRGGPLPGFAARRPVGHVSRVMNDPPPHPEDGAAGGGAASRLTIHRDRRGDWATGRSRRAGTGAGRPGRRGPAAGLRHRW